MIPDDTIVGAKRVLKATIKNFNGITIQGAKGEKGDKGDTGSKGDRGEKGSAGTKGKDGNDYILTEQDKIEIAETIEVPIVEKVIVEQPIVKEVAISDTAEQVRDKLSSLKDEERLDAKHIKNLPENRVGISGVREITAGTNITVDNSNPGYPVISSTGGGGGGDVVGPASATDNAIARYDLTTGKIIQDSGITIQDGTTGTLSNTNTGDQLMFGTIAVDGQTDLDPTGTGDTLIFEAGTNITITTNPASNTITINSIGGEQSTLDATTSQSINTNQFVRADATTGDITLTLINPATNQTVTIKKIDSTSNSVYVYSTSLIDGSTIAEISMENESITLKWTGTTYDIT